MDSEGGDHTQRQETMSVRPPILDRVAAAGHTIFDTGSYDLNLIAIRSKNREAGSFDDKFCIAFKDVNGVWTTHWMACTTDPGLPWLEAPGRESGTAILVAGQHRGAWKIDKHRNKYDALCQRLKPLPVYRDKNRDGTLDMVISSIEVGMWGINIHRASINDSVASVGRYSAGCIVIRDPKCFAQLMDLARRQIDYHPTWTSFSLTLLED
tara:strand:- start:408 stop:1037 length:630 start_codon:yes stop_codon:yes gene_type:complete